MLWTGTYSASGGKGLYPLQLSQWEIHVGEAEAAIANASFGVWSQRTRMAYFVDEQEAGRVCAWQ